MSTREAFHKWNDQQPESFYADKNKYDLMFEAWQACQAHNDAVIAELVEALEEISNQPVSDFGAVVMNKIANQTLAKHKGQS